MKKIIAKNIAEFRKAKGFTQQQLAAKINYSYKAVSKWETGEVVPSVEVLEKLADVFGVSISKILGQEQEAVAKQESKPKNKKKYFYISMFAISLTWIVLTIIAISLSLALGTKNVYAIFIWGLPLTALLAVIFNSLWGRGFMHYIYISLLVWTLLISLCLQFYKLDIWLILYIGVPAQLATIFGVKIFLKSKQKIEK